MIDIRGMSVEDAQKAVDRLKLDLTVFAFETKQSDARMAQSLSRMSRPEIQ